MSKIQNVKNIKIELTVDTKNLKIELTVDTKNLNF